MKKLLFIFCSIFTIGLYGQSFYDFGNEKSLDYAIRIKIIDSETRYPLSNVEVLLEDDEKGWQITRLKTDRNGVVIIFCGPFKNPGSNRFVSSVQRFRVKVQSEKYFQESIFIDGRKLYKNRRSSMIKFTHISFDFENNWSALGEIPGRRVIAEQLSLKRYEKVDNYLIGGNGRKIYWNAPGIFEYKIKMRLARTNDNERYNGGQNQNQGRNEREYEDYSNSYKKDPYELKNNSEFSEEEFRSQLNNQDQSPILKKFSKGPAIGYTPEKPLTKDFELSFSLEFLEFDKKAYNNVYLAIQLDQKVLTEFKVNGNASVFGSRVRWNEGVKYDIKLKSTNLISGRGKIESWINGNYYKKEYSLEIGNNKGYFIFIGYLKDFAKIKDLSFSLIDPQQNFK